MRRDDYEIALKASIWTISTIFCNEIYDNVDKKLTDIIKVITLNGKKHLIINFKKNENIFKEKYSLKTVTDSKILSMFWENILITLMFLKQSSLTIASADINDINEL